MKIDARNLELSWQQTHKHTHTNREDRLQYTAPLSLVRSVIKRSSTALRYVYGIGLQLDGWSGWKNRTGRGGATWAVLDTAAAAATDADRCRGSPLPPPGGLVYYLVAISGHVFPRFCLALSTGLEMGKHPEFWVRARFCSGSSSIELSRENCSGLPRSVRVREVDHYN